MDQRFRRGTIKDVPGLRELGLMAYGQHRPAMNEANWNKLRGFLSEPDTYADLMNTAVCFVCETGTRIVGMAFLVPKGDPTDLFEAHWSHIRMVGVDPAHAGRGIAKRLTRMCLDHARQTGERHVALHTSEFMDAARHIYEGFGFRVVRSFTRYDKQYWIYLLDLDNEQHDRLPH